MYIQLRASDFIIKKTVDNNGNKIPIVNIRWQLATDETFIQECIGNGVKKADEIEEEITV